MTSSLGELRREEKVGEITVKDDFLNIYVNGEQISISVSSIRDYFLTKYLKPYLKALETIEVSAKKNALDNARKEFDNIVSSQKGQHTRIIITYIKDKEGKVKKIMHFKINGIGIEIKQEQEGSWEVQGVHLDVESVIVNTPVELYRHFSDFSNNIKKIVDRRTLPRRILSNMLKSVAKAAQNIDMLTYISSDIRNDVARGIISPYDGKLLLDSLNIVSKNIEAKIEGLPEALCNILWYSLRMMGRGKE